MRNFTPLMVMAVAALAVSACSSEDDTYLGSRDDIIINNSGMMASKEAAEETAKEEAKQVAEAEIEEVKQDAEMAAKQEQAEAAAKVADAMAPAKEEPKIISRMETTTMKAPESTPTAESAEVASVAPAAAPAGMSGDIPPNAKPGECYAKALIPAVTETKSERVQISEEQKVLARIIPARYEVKTERVMVKEARQYWKAGHGPITKKDEVTGEIMCLVEEPAQYKTVEKRVLVEEEKPEYKMIPAQFETVSKTNVIQPERWEWRRILCETNMGPNSVMRIQQALKTKGHNIKIDGKLGNETMGALMTYQRNNGLATRGITYETLEHLGVQLIGA